jgi:hypothetical protein
MSPDQDLTFTLFTLHGLAVSLRDRADTHTERAEALLLGVERAYAQQMAGEPVVLGIHPKQPSYAFPARLSAPCGARLCPSGAQRAQRQSQRHPRPPAPAGRSRPSRLSVAPRPWPLCASPDRGAAMPRPPSSLTPRPGPRTPSTAPFAACALRPALLRLAPTLFPLERP